MKGKHLALMLIMTGMLHLAHAQIQVVPVYSGMIENMKWSEVYNVNLISNQDYNYLTVKITVLEQKSRKQVYESRSIPFTIATGMNNLSTKISFFKNQQYGSTPEALYLKTKSSYISGQYEACYTIYYSKEMNLLANACFNFSVVTPVIKLTSPAKSVASAGQLQFCWLSNSQNQNYSLKIVEQKHGQNKYEAISNNRAVVSISNINSNCINISSYGNSFHSNTTYVWQVTSYSNNINTSRSDPGDFDYNQQAPVLRTAHNNTTCYRLFDDIVNNGYYETSDTLKVAYNNEWLEKYLILRVTDESLNAMVTDSLPVVSGINKIDISTANLNLVQGKYLVFISDSRQTRFVKFEKK